MFLMMKKSPGAPWAGLPAAVRRIPRNGSDRKRSEALGPLGGASRSCPDPARNGSDRKRSEALGGHSEALGAFWGSCRIMPIWFNSPYFHNVLILNHIRNNTPN